MSNWDLSDAELFATIAHKGQTWGEFPYIEHCRRVYDVIINYSDACPIIKENIDILGPAAFLHDVLEDTTVTREQLASVFRSDVVDLVFAVTDEPGKNRKERKALTYFKIIQYGPTAVALKLADRLVNVKDSFQNNESLFQMYQKEHETFWARLHPVDISALQPLWQDLNAWFRI